MSDILRQVDEDLRKEKIHQLWKKYRFYVISFFFIVLIAVIGFQFWVSLDKSKNEKIVNKYINATNENDLNEGLAQLEEIIDADNIYLSGLAELKIANLYVSNGNKVEGSIRLEKIIKNNKYEPLIKDLARYFLLMLNVDSYSDDEFDNYLKNTKIQNSNLQYMFNELILIRKLLSGNKEESIKGFQELIDIPNVPNDIKIRAKKFIEVAN